MEPESMAAWLQPRLPLLPEVDDEFDVRAVRRGARCPRCDQFHLTLDEQQACSRREDE